LDNTWHRPFTTLELAALQSFFDPEDHWSADPLHALEIKRRHEMELFELYGSNDSDWRQRIGNAVPPKAAKAIADVMGTTLLLAATGETFVLSNMPIWVRPIAMAISVSRHAA
jgi:site-specific DNA-cytosine methylase